MEPRGKMGSVEMVELGGREEWKLVPRWVERVYSLREVERTGQVAT